MTSVLGKMVHTQLHSWYGRRAHVFRTDGRVVRATLGRLYFGPEGVHLAAEFQDAQKSITKHVSPVCVAAVQNLWLNVDVVSDVELPDEDADHTSFRAPQECERLPTLAVHDPAADHVRVLRSIVVQTNHVLKAYNQPVELQHTTGVKKRSSK